MSVLIYAESWEGKFKKSTFEAVSYAKKTAELLKSNLVAISVGAVDDEDLKRLGQYGVTRVITCNDIPKADTQALSNLVENIVTESNIHTIIFSSTYTSRMIAPRLAVKMKAGIVSNVMSTPNSIEPFLVKRKSFSGKAFEFAEITTAQRILTISPNAFGIIESNEDCVIERRGSVNRSENITVKSKEKTSGKISLSEADIIISAGRGLKGPENWGMIEDLAELLEAGTACSKPVSDIGWRPHSEHVGQTGKTVSPNLYIAIGISGAIQHLAGVNASKKMVVINTDPEAPFFKAADYGIVGDAFDVVPKLIEEIKKIKN